MDEWNCSDMVAQLFRSFFFYYTFFFFMRFDTSSNSFVFVQHIVIRIPRKIRSRRQRGRRQHPSSFQGIPNTRARLRGIVVEKCQRWHGRISRPSTANNSGGKLKMPRERGKDQRRGREEETSSHKSLLNLERMESVVCSVIYQDSVPDITAE